MQQGSHDSPAERDDQAPDGTSSKAAVLAARASRLNLWRYGTPAMLILSGALFAISAEASDGTDLRPGRNINLAELVGEERRIERDLRGQLVDLEDEVSDLSEQTANRTGDERLKKIQKQIEKLNDPAGRTPKQGAGLTIELSDAPSELIENADDVNLLLVHQQDIQAVVNALWRGGAEAVTVQGQRIVTTTGIKCEGNAVQLQGVPYSQPYVINGIGDIDELRAAVDNDEYLSFYRNQAVNPEIKIGWDMVEQTSLYAPAYDGLRTFNYARPKTD
ncbi:DUF881 domain-containing protein [Nocardioides speluncae]|uniref:DUF881 domain-containing protein n=1 Tax=Nocardioides speluncae TaxID=2670337 RepID=UPI001F0C0418|nr:DUF881 domain-containing protein [Nocardioides speluncae]